MKLTYSALKEAKGYKFDSQKGYKEYIDEFKAYNFTHAKIRPNSKFIQCYGRKDGKTYRFTTKKVINLANMLYVEKNFEKLISNKILADKEAKRNIGFSIKEYCLNILDFEAKTSKQRNTIKRYKNVLDKHINPNIGHFDIRKITPSLARDIFITYFQDLGVASKHIILCVLRKCFAYAYKENLLKVNPFLDITLQRRRVAKKVTKNNSFTQAQVKQMLDFCDDCELRDYLYIAFFSGMRTGEILALNYEDIDLENNKIIVNKSSSDGITIDITKTSNSDREINIIPQLKQYLKQNLRKNATGRIFKKRIEFYRTAFKRLCLFLEIPYKTLYSTRHTFASIALSNGEEIAWISNMLGHSDIATTLKHYARFITYDKEHGLKMVV